MQQQPPQPQMGGYPPMQNQGNFMAGPPVEGFHYGSNASFEQARPNPMLWIIVSVIEVLFLPMGLLSIVGLVVAVMAYVRLEGGDVEGARRLCTICKYMSIASIGLSVLLFCFILSIFILFSGVAIIVPLAAATH